MELNSYTPPAFRQEIGAQMTNAVSILFPQSVMVL